MTGMNKWVTSVAPVDEPRSVRERGGTASQADRLRASCPLPSTTLEQPLSPIVDYSPTHDSSSSASIPSSRRRTLLRPRQHNTARLPSPPRRARPSTMAPNISGMTSCAFRPSLPSTYLLCASLTDLFPACLQLCLRCSRTRRPSCRRPGTSRPWHDRTTETQRRHRRGGLRSGMRVEGSGTIRQGRLM